MSALRSSPVQRRLGAALRRLKVLQDRGQVIVQSADLADHERKALTDAGFLQRIAKGWYLVARPGEAPGDTTAWFAAMRDFVGAYSTARFGDAWHVSPAYSVSVHAGATALPAQIIVHSPRATNRVVALPNDSSLLHYKAPYFPAKEKIERRGALRVLTLAAALVRLPSAFYETSATDAQIALATLTDASDLNRELLGGGHSVVAGRLAGALRTIGRPELADDILSTMRTAGYDVRESNPFLTPPSVLATTRIASPYVHRLQLVWHAMRDEVLRHFPDEPGLPKNVDAYLSASQENYRADAYHSLSIEGYRVTDALIDRVATGAWSPEQHAADTDARNAMAAHGYWRAFAAVQASLGRILTGDNPGAVGRADHGTWYRALFGASIEAGILSVADLAGYRNAPVYIKNAAHVPPPYDAVREMMPALFDLIADEPSAAVRAVLGHFCFVFIHPYFDGNGRIGRFLMNAMLASGGYPWTIIRVEWRDQYIGALDAASTRHDIGPFAEFIASAVLSAPRSLTADE